MTHHIMIDRRYPAKAERILESDLAFAAQALREKAEKDERSATDLAAVKGHAGLVDQFRRQAIAARALADRLENAESGMLIVDTAA